MKVIIAGSRTVIGVRALFFVEKQLRQAPWPITEVVSGVAAGPDRIGLEWALKRGIPVKRMPANWREDGRAAGFYRNTAMAEYADALIAFWDGESRGTAHMIRCMNGAGKPLVVHRFIGDGLDC